MSMRRLVQAAAVGAACLAIPLSQARAQLTFGVGGGVSWPVGSLSDTHVTGYNVLAQLGIGMPDWPVELRVDGMFNQMNHQATTPTVGNLQLWTLNANLVWNIAPFKTSGITPYLIGGAGYYNSSYHIGTSGTSIGAGGNTKANSFGLNGGIGIKAGAATLQVFVESRFHYIFVSGGHEEFVPLSAGIIF